MSDYKALCGRMVINEMELKGIRCITIIHVLLFFTCISLIKNTDDQDHSHHSAVLSKYIIGAISITLSHALFLRIIFIIIILWSLPLILVPFFYFGSPPYFLYYTNSFVSSVTLTYLTDFLYASCSLIINYSLFRNSDLHLSVSIHFGSMQMEALSLHKDIVTYHNPPQPLRFSNPCSKQATHFSLFLYSRMNIPVYPSQSD
jgi:hypothetical protein